MKPETMTKRNTRKPKVHYKSVVRLACLLILGPTMFSVGMGDSGPARASNTQNKPIVVIGLSVLPFNDGNNPYAPMMNAIKNGNINKVDELLRNGFDINTIMCLNLRPPMRYSHLIPGGNPNPSTIDTIQQERILLSKPDGNIWLVTGSGLWVRGPNGETFATSIWIAGTPLMYACWLRNPVMVKHLLEKGANPNVWIKFKSRSVKDNLSRPWLSVCHYLSMLMCSTDTWKRDASKIAEINKMLLDAGLRFPDKEDGYFKKTDDFGRTALWDAFETLDPFWLKVLLEQKKYNPRERDGGDASFVEFLEKIDSNFWNDEFVLGKIQEMKELLEKYGYKEHGKNKSGSGGYKFIEVE